MKYTPEILRGMLHSVIRKMGERLEEYVKCPGRPQSIKDTYGRKTTGKRDEIVVLLSHCLS